MKLIADARPIIALAKVAMDRIELNPEICGGKPVIQGTRIPVATLLGFLRAGDTVEQVLAAYPQLTREDLLACLEYDRRRSSP